MAAWTPSELASATLRGMRILGVGQSPSAEDADIVTDSYAGVYRELRRLGLAPFAEAAIPEEFQQPMRTFMASAIGDQFGFDQGVIGAWRQDGLVRLRQQSSSDKQASPVKANYF